MGGLGRRADTVIADSTLERAFGGWPRFEVGRGNASAGGTLSVEGINPADPEYQGLSREDIASMQHAREQQVKWDEAAALREARGHRG